MSDESKSKTPVRLEFVIVFVLLTLVACLVAWPARRDSADIAPPSPQVDGSSNQASRRNVAFDRMPFGATQAVAIAIEEVKRREGWSAKPEWVKNVGLEEGPNWVVTVPRRPRSSVDERRVEVSSRTGKVVGYK